MVRVVVGLVLVGGRRLRHLAYVADDPVSQPFGGVRVMPTARTTSRWVRHFTMRTVTRLQALNAAVVNHLRPGLELRTWTVDVDGVEVSTGLQVERAARGYNQHPPGCAAVAAGPRRGLCHQSPVLSLVGSAALHPGDPHLGAGGARRDRLRCATRGNAPADPSGLTIYRKKVRHRGNHEKTIAQLKTALAFHSVPTQTYAANSAWQQLVVLAHNLLTNFQLETGAPSGGVPGSTRSCRCFKVSRRCASNCSIARPVRLEFLVTPPSGVGPGPGSERSSARGRVRHEPPDVRWRSLTACGRPTLRGSVPNRSTP